MNFILCLYIKAVSNLIELEAEINNKRGMS